MAPRPDPTAADVQRVNQQLEERHVAFRASCHEGEGDATACHSWGEWLSVVDKDYAQAAAMYRLNCDKNKHPASCFNLGRLLLSGKGVDADDAEARRLFRQSCADGHAHGCHHLGLMLSNGLGGEKNTRQGLNAFIQACQLDDAASCYKVASMYLTGVAAPESTPPIARDPKKARVYLERACDANFAPACHNLAVMYKKGEEGIALDESKYEEYKKKTSELVEQAGGISMIKSA